MVCYRFTTTSSTSIIIHYLGSHVRSAHVKQMAAFEDLFNTSLLEVLTPVSSAKVPPSNDSSISDSWLENIEDETTDRTLAFFGKVHTLILTAIPEPPLASRLQLPGVARTFLLLDQILTIICSR